MLDMIRHNMIIVEPETVYKTRRMHCEEVCEALKIAYRKCCEDPDYATKPTPWVPKRLTSDPLMESVHVSMTEHAKEVITENIARLRVHWGATEDQMLPAN
jgi:hypothetical protein